MKIFSYGSDMNIVRLTERVPSALYLTTAFINNYSLKLNKVSKDGSSKANIVPTEIGDDIVWGVIFEIDSNDKSKLDKAEGLGNGYNETTLNFIASDGAVYLAQVYIADSNAIDENLLPYDWYMKFIITGAEQNQLPSSYIGKISATEYIIDPDEERRQKNLSIINKERDCNK